MKKVWKPIKGFEDIAEISIYGEIHRFKSNTYTYGTINNNGYLRVTFFVKGKQEFRMDKNAPKAYKTIQSFLDSYMAKHNEVKIDFIHDEDELLSVSDKNESSVAIAMPALTKDDLFDYIAGDLVLPRKSFSMGHANEKRYYLEAKKITK